MTFNNMYFRFPFFPVIMGLFLLASCARDEDQVMDRTLVTSDEITRAADGGIEDMVDAVSFRLDSDEVSLPGCVVITDSGSEVYPRTITLDFGDGCTDPSGRTRTGMIHMSISAPWTEVGSIREVTFEDFTVTRPMQDVAIGVEGVRQLERLEPGEEGEARWARNLNTILTHPEFTVERQFSGIRRWISGEGDPEADQVFGLTGSGSLIRNGLERTRTIVSEVILDRTCGEPVAGVVEIQRPLMGTATLDFGEGECDGTAILTHNGEVFVIDL